PSSCHRDVCDPTTCSAGCCDSGVCQPRSRGACGPAGGSCQACDPATADHCADDGTCACGTHAPCGTGTECVNEECVCNAASCPHGCCAGNVCNEGDTRTSCGTSGMDCQPCGAG